MIGKSPSHTISSEIEIDIVSLCTRLVAYTRTNDNVIEVRPTFATLVLV